MTHEGDTCGEKISRVKEAQRVARTDEWTAFTGEITCLPRIRIDITLFVEEMLLDATQKQVMRATGFVTKFCFKNT